jgi:pimeloyl-ACP methyl ester carboxylesterase
MRPNHLLPLVLPLALVACGGGTNSSTNLADAQLVDTATPGGDGSIVDGSTGARDPALDGDATVMTSTASIPGAAMGRTLSSTVFKPSTAGPHALVVISPGFQLGRAQYTSYARHLATWGFVVVLTDYAGASLFPNHTTLATDVPKVIDWALAQTSLAVDPQKIALAGHSLGGKISVYAATLDTRVKAVVAWDPVDSSSPSVAPELMGTVTAAIAVIGETTNGSGGSGGMPCAPTADNFQTFYAAARSPALAITVTGADHMDWVDDPNCTLCTFCTAGAAPQDRARVVTRRLDVAWLRRTLFSDLTMDAWLDSPPELATSAVSIARR